MPPPVSAHERTTTLSPADALTVARAYLDAWNRRDPAAIQASFAEGGTYRDPGVPDGLTGPAIAAYADIFFAAFPDLSFEIVSAAPAGEGIVAVQWLMRGTNSGPLRGNPPTGRTIALPGADFITVADGKVRSVEGYFDQKTFLEQLGLQAIVVPASAGPLVFGSSTYLQLGTRTKPGAFGLTWIDARSDEEVARIRDSARRVAGEMARMPGFITWLGAVVGRRLFTITAWENPANTAQLLRDGAHREAMEQFYKGELGSAAHTTVWVPHHQNTLWVRCTGCGQMADYEKTGGTCTCGQALPEQPAYW
jgi:steroid delta-isomerase-like uncharacterized protein